MLISESRLLKHTITTKLYLFISEKEQLNDLVYGIYIFSFCLIDVEVHFNFLSFH